MQEKRFIDLWMRVGSRAGEAKARHVYADLLSHYGEAQRRYHTIDHILHCLRHVDRIPDSYENKDAVELAIWFHDAIYEIGDPTNERRSEQWFQAQSLGDLPAALVEQVARLIIATEHREPPTQTDAGYVVDIDLSSFGRPYLEFVADSQLVRDESTHLDDKQFFVGQREFLKSLMRRGRVFHTDLFNELLEERARENIKRTLDDIDRRFD